MAIGSDAFQALLLHARCRQHRPSLDELQQEFRRRVGRSCIHHDHGDIGAGVRFLAAAREAARRACLLLRTARLMDAVADMSGTGRAGTCTFESFGVDARTALPKTRVSRSPRARTGAPCRGQQRSIDSRGAARERHTGCAAPARAAPAVPASTTLISGEVDHRDMVLDGRRAGDQIMVCVSRAQSAELVLDL